MIFIFLGILLLFLGFLYKNKYKVIPYFFFLFFSLSFYALAQQNNFYIIDNVDVDVTAKSAAEARDLALIQGQRIGFQRLLQQLVSPQDVARFSQISDADITKLVEDFEIQSEKASAVRYIGKLTFHFQTEAIQSLLQENNIAFNKTVDRPPLVLPILTMDTGSLLFEDNNLWFNAWQLGQARNQLLPVIVPSKDTQDMALLDGAEALLGNQSALARIMERYRTNDVIVIELRPTINTKNETVAEIMFQRYSPTGKQDQFSQTIPLPNNADFNKVETFQPLVDQVVNNFQTIWNRPQIASLPVGPESSLLVRIMPVDLKEWSFIYEKLKNLPGIKSVQPLSLRKSNFLVSIIFVGDESQLINNLQTQSLRLSMDTNGNKLITLSP
ncbi:MAG: DUF2066 domain-containing protein [Alphaproteobacteria bacterium]|nr:DUF2066 domain-containing protein [Alphaproteobacteria bacterium]